MKHPAFFFAFLTIISLFIQSFYSMLEMSCVSFNKVRLQYYISKKKKRALWLSYLIKHPARLFGTTLIGVNAAMQFGSETARRFYSALDLSPDLAPLTQVILVLLFAELSPMFAGRRYAEHVTMLGIPFIYLSSIILAPFIWLLDLLSRDVHAIFRISTKRIAYHLSRQELQKAIEERDEPLGNVELNTTLSNIFSLREKTAKDLMLPVSDAISLPIEMNIGEVRKILSKNFASVILLYQDRKENVIGITYPRDFLRMADSDSVEKASHSPWFITQKNSIFQILKQFRWNNQSLAIVLDDQGRTQGILTLDVIVNEIFHAEMGFEQSKEKFIDRSFPGDMLIEEVNKILSIQLDSEGKETLEDLLKYKLGHHPAVGESIHIGPFELTVEEASLLEVIKVRLQTFASHL